jgi:hypothetical protein
LTDIAAMTLPVPWYFLVAFTDAASIMAMDATLKDFPLPALLQ